MANHTHTHVAPTTTEAPLLTGITDQICMLTEEDMTPPYDARCVAVEKRAGMYHYTLDIEVPGEGRTVRGVIAVWELPDGNVLFPYSKSLASLNRGAALPHTVIKTGSAWWWKHSGGLISWPTEVLG